MLQQTQVTTVIPYFERWMSSAPDVATLVKLSNTQLHKLWEGLGYYTRARNLQKAAAQIVNEHHGEFPSTVDSLRALSGIGRYTAGAISSIAFNQPQPIVDGNVIRVLSRLHGIEGNPKDKEVIERFWDSARSLVEAASRLQSTTPAANKQLNFAGNCSMLNQSLMELGATICTPKNPQCGRCPLRRRCYANKQDCIESFPRLPARIKPTPRRFIAFLIGNRDCFYVRQRPDGIVNAQLWEFPNVELNFNTPHSIETALAQLRLKGVETEHVTTIKHSITRYRMHTECYRVLGDQQLPNTTGQLMSRSQISKLPFTSAHRRLIAFI